MFALLSLGLLSSAAAFSAAPARRADAAVSMSLQRSKALPFLIRPANVDESMPGYKGFDPLGLAKIDDLGLDVYWMREAELKHCRLAMLAVVGLLAQGAGFVVPGQSSESNQVKAFWQLLETNPGPIYAAFLFISIAEVVDWVAILEGKKSGDRAPGEFGFNPLAFGKTPDSAKNLADKEVENGRLAMWAAAGLLLQESLGN